MNRGHIPTSILDAIEVLLKPHISKSQIAMIRNSIEMMVNGRREIPVGQMLTVKEVAERWKCSLPTVWRRIKEGYICTIKIGGITRVPETELMKYEAPAVNNNNEAKSNK